MGHWIIIENNRALRFRDAQHAMQLGDDYNWEPIDINEIIRLPSVPYDQRLYQAITTETERHPWQWVMTHMRGDVYMLSRWFPDSTNRSSLHFAHPGDAVEFKLRFG